jgi:hypothetical protein
MGQKITVTINAWPIECGEPCTSIAPSQRLAN